MLATKLRFMGLAALAFAVWPANAKAATFGFSQITSNGDVNVAGQLFVDRYKDLYFCKGGAHWVKLT